MCSSCYDDDTMFGNCNLPFDSEVLDIYLFIIEMIDFLNFLYYALSVAYCYRAASSDNMSHKMARVVPDLT